MKSHRDEWGAFDGKNQLAYSCPSTSPHFAFKRSLLSLAITLICDLRVLRGSISTLSHPCHLCVAVGDPCQKNLFSVSLWLTTDAKGVPESYFIEK